MLNTLAFGDVDIDCRRLKNLQDEEEHTFSQYVIVRGLSDWVVDRLIIYLED